MGCGVCICIYSGARQVPKKVCVPLLNPAQPSEIKLRENPDIAHRALSVTKKNFRAKLTNASADGIEALLHQNEFCESRS